MLGIMRKYKQSIVIKIVFGIIVLSFIGTIFLVWGRGDKTDSTSGYAAKVNGTKIGIEDYQKAYYRLRGLYEQIYGRSLSPEMEKQMGLKKLALESLIDSVLVSKEADKMGIKVSKDEVAAAIAAVPAFQKDGSFSFPQYQQTLKANRLTVGDFEANQKDELKIKKAKDKIKEKATVTDDEALQAFKKQRDKVDLVFVSYSPAGVKGEVKLTDQDLNTYLQNHQEQFKTPEQISLSYCLINPAKLGAKVTVSDEETEAFYRKNMDRYQSKGEILPFTQVKDRAKADALKAKADKEAYELAADAVNKNAKAADLKSAATALGCTVEQTALFTVTTPPAALVGENEVIKRAFALKQGEVGGPVETGRGIYLLKVNEKKPAAVPPMAQIRLQVETRATEEKAQELAKKKADDALTQLPKGDAGVKTEETGAFSYSDKGVVPKVGTSPELMEAAFALTAAAPVAKTTFKIGDRWYAVKLKNRVAADTAEFQKEKEKLKQSMLPKKQQDALDTWLKELRKKAKIETNPAVLAD